MSSSSAASSSSRESTPEPPKSKIVKRKANSDSDSSSESSESERVTKAKTKSAKIKSKKAKSSKKAALPDDSSSESEGEGGANDAEETEEQKALSHAERRRQKKAAKRAAAETANPTPSKKRKLKDGSAKDASKEAKDAVQKPRQNSVWVGNLSFKTTQENLRTFFASCGEITRINLPMKVASRPNLPMENKGCVCSPLHSRSTRILSPHSFAYVDFATPEGKTAAIALSEQPLIGRKLLIKDGTFVSAHPLHLTNLLKVMTLAVAPSRLEWT